MRASWLTDTSEAYTLVWAGISRPSSSTSWLDTRVCTAPTGRNGWDALRTTVAECGLPRQLLSDNGLNFTGRLQGYVVAFERHFPDGFEFGLAVDRVDARHVIGARGGAALIPLHSQSDDDDFQALRRSL